jgi:hypothetical protein
LAAQTLALVCAIIQQKSFQILTDQIVVLGLLILIKARLQRLLVTLAQ